MYKVYDRLCAQRHFPTCNEIRVKLRKEHWYEHVPKSLETSHESKVTMLHNQQVNTDRRILNNKADIIIRDDEKETCVLMDACNFRRQKCDKYRSQENSKI
jgi:hypothetical protein